jgi:F420-dependent oxidoreductase-like protein
MPQLEKTGAVAFWKKYDRKAVLRQAQIADEMGYHSFWLPEAWGYEVFSLLTEIATHTKNIQLGTGIINVFSRSAALAAMHAATLDEISGGRFILGLGTSGKKVVEGFHGVDYRKPLTRLSQYIRIVKTLLAGEPLDSAGADLWEFRHFKLEMTPARADLPVYCACLNDKAIRMVGELADGWMPTFWPWQQIGRGRELLAEGAARSGRSADDITIAPFTTAMPMPDRKSGHDMARGLIAFYIGGMGDYYHALLSRMGYADNADLVQDLYVKGKRQEAAAAISEELLEALVIAGEPDQCREQLTAWREAGVQLPVLTLPSGAPPEISEALLQLMAPA